MAQREPRIQSIKSEKKSHLKKISHNLIFLEMFERERERERGGKNPSAISRVSSVGSRQAQS